MPVPEPLPHGYPFRFVDRTLVRTGPASGRVRALVTAGGRAVDGGRGSAPFSLVEMVAQAALLLEGGDPEIGRSGFLAGLSDFVVQRLPLPGDSLEVDVTLAARLGPVVRFDGVIRDDSGAPVATGSVTVRKGEAP